MKRITHSFTLLCGLYLASCSSDNNSKTVSPFQISLVQYASDDNYNRYAQGEELFYQLKEIIQDPTAPDIQTKGNQLLDVIQDINRSTTEIIGLIHKLQIGILKTGGIEIKEFALNYPIQEKWDYNSSKPIKYNLDVIDPQIFSTTHNLTDADKKAVQEAVLNYRAFVTESLASSSSNDEHKYFFKDPKINTIEDLIDFTRRLREAALSASQDDMEMLVRIYVNLTVAEDVVERLLTTECSRLDAFGLLINLESEILQNRYEAIMCIRSRICGSNYAFNKIIPTTEGPSVVKRGATIKFIVAMAAYNSDQQPFITVEGGSIEEVKEGEAFISFKGSKPGLQKVKGTITILNKAGIPHMLPWEKEIYVVE